VSSPHVPGPATAVRSRSAPWVTGPAAERMSQLEAAHQECTVEQVQHSVAAGLAAHHRELAAGLVLYAGTNVLSPAVESVVDHALSTRPALGWPGAKVQTAVGSIEHLEVLAGGQVARAMRARFAEVRFLTATMANLAVYAALTSPGDTIAVLSPEAGGHASHQGPVGTAGLLGLRVEHLPYDRAALDVDHDRLPEFLRGVRPRLVMVGGSVTLFPHDVVRLRAAADEVGAAVVYDASHTAGLVAAGLFQDPLAEGAHVVTLSTYKTFGGPAGGAAVTDDAGLAQRIAEVAYPRLMSNYDPARLGPLAVAAAEAREQQPAWARATVQLAQRLAHELDRRDANVFGLLPGARPDGRSGSPAGSRATRTHQVVLDVSEVGGGAAVARHLEARGLFTGACRLPSQRPGDTAAGLRLGVQELVRRGMPIEAAPDLADLIVLALDGTAPAVVTAGLHRVQEACAVDLWGRPGGGAVRDHRCSAAVDAR